MRLSKQLKQSEFKKPQDEAETKDLVETSFVNHFYSGFPDLNVMATKIFDGIESVFSARAEKEGYTKISTPLLHRKELYEENENFSEFEENIFTFDNYVLRPRSEDYMQRLYEKGLSSYRQLPMKHYQIASSFRDIERAEGILKGREFRGMVLHDLSEQGSATGRMNGLTAVVDGVLEDLGINTEKIVGGNTVNYVYPHKQGSEIETSNGTVKGLSLSMGYKFDNVNENIQYRDENNSLRTPDMLSLGIGSERIFFAALSEYRDEKGFQFPRQIRPYDKAIVTINVDEDNQGVVENYYNSMRDGSVYLDDRDLSLGKKLDYADFIGVQEKHILGDREIEEGEITIKTRDEKSSTVGLEGRITEENGF